MSLKFQLSERLFGIALHAATVGEQVEVLTNELLGPHDPQLMIRLDELQAVVFSKIAGLPSPSVIDHLLVMIDPDLNGTAYVNELPIQAMVRANRIVEPGTPVFERDLLEVVSVDLGVSIPPDCALIVVRSKGWRRSLYWDFGPLNLEYEPRAKVIEKVLVEQELLLLDLPIEVSNPEG